MASLDERAIRVENYKNVLQAFGKASRHLEKNFRAELREAVEPVRAEAERLAGSGAIENLKTGDDWTKVRTGVTRSVVYIAPRERGRRSTRAGVGRPNLKPLLLDRAYEPALTKHRDDIIEDVDSLLGDVARIWDNA
jgi:hypothetical protein